jgi:hypothetical protein
MIVESMWKAAALLKCEVVAFTSETENKKKLRGFGPLENYADPATAASWRSSTNFCG